MLPIVSVPIPATYDLTVDNPRGDESVVEGADNAWEIPFTTAVATDFSTCAKRCEFREGVRAEFPDDVMATATAEIVSDTPTAHRLFIFLPHTAVFTTRSGRWDAEAYTLDELGEDELVYRVQMGAWALSQEVTGS